MSKRAGLLTVVALSAGLAAPPARAITLGDAALTVAITTGTGAALGASTLPFYENSGDHTKNIFYGAAVGAVAGVLMSAIAGVSDGQTDNAAHLRQNTEHDLARRDFFAPETHRTVLAKKGETIVWSPLAKIRF